MTEQKLATGACPDALGQHLQQIVDRLRQAQDGDGCLLDRCPEDDSHWLESIRNPTQTPLRSPLDCPEAPGFIDSLDSRLAGIE